MNDQALAIPSLTEALANKDGYESAVKKCNVILSSDWCPAHIKTPHALMAIVSHGRALGLDPWEAIQSMQLVLGQPTFKAATLRGLLEKRYPGCIQVLQSDDDACRIKVKVRDIETGKDAFVIQAFTSKDAEAAGLLSGRNGATWKKWKADMLFARCISRVQKKHLPIGGGSEVWVAELVQPKAQPQTLADLGGE